MGQRVDFAFQIVGMFAVAAVGLVLFVFVVGIPMAAGYWTLDRFGFLAGQDVVILRQDSDAGPMRICADGTVLEPKHCLSAAEIIRFARTGK